MNDADALRQVISLGSPDPRMLMGVEDPKLNLTARHRFLSALDLPQAVPEEVRIHFETAKNVLLYSWCVYRFHMVAEQYALSTLEFAFRDRLQALGIISFEEGKPPGLRFLLKTARDSGLINNRRFGPGGAYAYERARQRQSLEAIRHMTENGLEEYEYDESSIEALDEDSNVDWISHFTNSLPDLRNMHAHGTSMLYPTVANTFTAVADLIRQIHEQGAPGQGDVTLD
jgi:hypothetical protein